MTDTNQSTHQPISFFKDNFKPLLVIMLLSVGLYVQSIGFDYVLDDTMVITKNQFTQRGFGGISDIFKYESFRGYFGEKKQLLEGDRYRPLSIATFAVEQSLFGGNKSVSHFINIVLYALTGILLFRVLLFMFPVSEKGREKWYWTAPFIISVLFIVHPLHVEVVANIKGRDEILAFLGEMACLYCTFQYLNKNKIQYLIASLLTFLIGILSKESVITFLAIVPLTAHFVTKATAFEKLKVTLPIIAATVVYLLLRINAIGYLLGEKEITDVMNNPFYGMNWADKMATIFYTLLLYFKLHIFPHPLTHDYYPYQIPKMSWGDWQPITSLLLHFMLFFIVFKDIFTKKKTIWAYAAGFYLITLSIVSNVMVSVGTFMNERFVYHASLGFCMVLGYFLSEKWDNTILKDGVQTWKKIVLGIFILGFSLKTLIRIPDWENATTLNNSAIIYSPNSARANCFYGVSIWENVYSKLPKDADKTQKMAVLDSMMPYFDKSVSIVPRYSAAEKMRAMVAIEKHKLNNDLEALLRTLGEVNMSGTYEASILPYLKMLNEQLSYKDDAGKLLSFYSAMSEYFSKNYPKSIMPSEYAQMQEDVKMKMDVLK